MRCLTCNVHRLALTINVNKISVSIKLLAFSLIQFHFSLLFLLQRVIKLGPQKFACTICKAVMKSAQNVERHMHTHTGQKPFQCPHCSAAFTQKSNCLRHMLKLHSSIQ